MGFKAIEIIAIKAYIFLTERGVLIFIRNIFNVKSYYYLLYLLF